MEYNLQKFETNQEASAAAGETLNRLLTEAKEGPVLLLLSGGSAFELLNYISASSLGENLTVTMLDERFSQEKKANNFLRLQDQEFYNLAMEKEVNFIGTLPRPGEIPEDLRARWEISLKTWKTNYPEGKIYATFGIGQDGHTAGIFPMPDNPKKFVQNFENNHWVAAYEAASSHTFPQRVTTTFSFFKLIDQGIVYACGPDKSIAVKRFLKGKEQAHELPAVGIYQAKEFKIFTDIPT